MTVENGTVIVEGESLNSNNVSLIFKIVELKAGGLVNCSVTTHSICACYVL